MASAQDAPAAVGAMTVQGPAELTAAEAFDAARGLACERIEERWRMRANRLIVERRPPWAPRLAAEWVLHEWLAQFDPAMLVELLDRQDAVREHEFGASYQTTLTYGERPDAAVQLEQELRQRRAEVSRRTARCGVGSAVGWALLGVLVHWLDRLSRGYMTVRLRLLGALAALAVPPLAFLL